MSLEDGGLTMHVGHMVVYNHGKGSARVTDQHSHPNLFRRAQSELSQDAILCWLLEWSDPAFATANSALHATGHELLRRIFSLCGQPVPAAAQTITIQQQVAGLDVLALVGDEYAVLLEDKTDTREHSGQLERYAQAIKKKYPDRRQLCVYCKTGEQDEYDGVRAAGYHVLGRSELLEVMRFGQEAGVQHDAFREYHEYLAELDSGYAAFETALLSEWTGNPWQGFFVWLQKTLKDGGWGYVANEAGGFMGYWWHWRVAAGHSVYLQLENERLCFKIEVKDAAQRSRRRNAWYQHLLGVARDCAFSIEKPARFGNGLSMTVALKSGDYRHSTDKGTIDLDATIGTLHAAEQLLDRAVASFGQ
jgi:hypothetical protein